MSPGFDCPQSTSLGSSLPSFIISLSRVGFSAQVSSADSGQSFFWFCASSGGMRNLGCSWRTRAPAGWDWALADNYLEGRAFLSLLRGVLRSRSSTLLL